MKQSNKANLFKYIGLSILVVISPIFLFQNCSQLGNPDDTDFNSGGFISVAPSDANHPPTEILAPPSKQIRLANRRYMTEIFKSVFTSSNRAKAPGLDNLTFTWAERRGAQLGGACDMNDSLTLMDCNDDFGSSALPIHGDSNAVRESFKIQLCEEMTGTNEGLSIALGNAGIDMAALPEPSFENMRPLYELFYRTDDVPNYFLQTMSQLGSELKDAGESPTNIWRGLLILVCESPEWQKL